MKAFVFALRLRMVGPTVRHTDPQPQQPHRERRVRLVAAARPRRAIVHQHPLRQAVATKGTISWSCTSGAVRLAGRQTQRMARVIVEHGQRMTTISAGQGGKWPLKSICHKSFGAACSKRSNARCFRSFGRARSTRPASKSLGSCWRPEARHDHDPTARLATSARPKPGDASAARRQPAPKQRRSCSAKSVGAAGRPPKPACPLRGSEVNHCRETSRRVIPNRRQSTFTPIRSCAKTWQLRT